MYYTYDGNGNVIRISEKAGDGQNSSNSNSDNFSPPVDTGANTGWAGVAYGREPGGGGGNEQCTQYKWDEENRLIHAKVNGSEIDFLYNAGGERTAKQGKDGEVIYYDKMFQVKTNVSPLHITKHIFLGSTRVVSKLSHEIGPIDQEYEKRNAYYYHGDHLGSSNYLTDYEGNEYEHYEYTPFGEMWVEEESDSLDKINFKFTSKELDEETGLYYFGARYLDAKASRWLSCDPILNDYLPSGDKERDKNLPGLGGVFNPVNLAVYHYAGNNPLKYTDPDGETLEIYFMVNKVIENKHGGKTTIGDLYVRNKDTDKVFIIRGVRSGGIGVDDETNKKSHAPYGSYDILETTKEGALYQRLEAKDGKYGDDIVSFEGQEEHTLIRLHYEGNGYTWGCISVPDEDAEKLLQEIKNTSTEKVTVKSKSRNPFKQKEIQKKYGEIIIFKKKDESLK